MQPQVSQQVVDAGDPEQQGNHRCDGGAVEQLEDALGHRGDASDAIGGADDDERDEREHGVDAHHDPSGIRPPHAELDHQPRGHGDRGRQQRPGTPSFGVQP